MRRRREADMRELTIDAGNIAGGASMDNSIVIGHGI